MWAFGYRAPLRVVGAMAHFGRLRAVGVVYLRFGIEGFGGPWYLIFGNCDVGLRIMGCPSGRYVTSDSACGFGGFRYSAGPPSC